MGEAFDPANVKQPHTAPVSSSRLDEPNSDIEAPQRRNVSWRESVLCGQLTLDIGPSTGRLAATAPAMLAITDGDEVPDTREGSRSRDWAIRRREALREAPSRRDRQLAKTGGLLPLVP